jgi:peroxiredoxin
MEPTVVLWLSLLSLMVLGNLFLTFVVIRKVNGTQPMVEEEGLPAGSSAPDFRAIRLTGETVSLANYAGRSVAFIFITPGCRPCREELPSYINAYEHARRNNTEIVLVSSASVEDTRALANEYDLTIPLLVTDPPSSFMKDYNADGTPFYVLLDRAGIVISSGYTTHTGGTWHRFLASWRAETPRSTSLATDRGR